MPKDRVEAPEASPSLARLADIEDEAGRDPAYDIDALLAEITPGNRHGAIGFGASTGREVW